MITRKDLDGGFVDARLTLLAIAGSLESVAAAFKEGYAAESLRLGADLSKDYGEMFQGYARMVRDALRNMENDFQTDSTKAGGGDV